MLSLLATAQFPSTGKFPINPDYIWDRFYCIIRVDIQIGNWQTQYSICQYCLLEKSKIPIFLDIYIKVCSVNANSIFIPHEWYYKVSNLILSAPHFLTAVNMWHAWYVTRKVSVYIVVFWVITVYSWVGEWHLLWQIYCYHLQSVRPYSQARTTTTGIFTAVKISNRTWTISLVERG
jgi:hypothetical protein